MKFSKPPGLPPGLRMLCAKENSKGSGLSLGLRMLCSVAALCLSTALGQIAEAKPAKAELSPPVSRALLQLESYIQTEMRKHGYPGCAVAVVHQGKVVLLKGFGNTKKGSVERINADTVFQLGSVSKPVTATLIARLQQKGSLKVTAPITRYIQSFLAKDFEQNRNLKIWHLLSHTTGWGRHGFNQQIESKVTRPLLLKNLQKSLPLGLVGRHYDYHNVAFSLIEDVVTSAEKQPFTAVLKNELFKPLNMYRTTSSWGELMAQKNRAWPHVRDKNNRIRPLSQYSKHYYEAVCSAAGINSSVRDMSAFLRLQMGDFPQILGKDSLRIFHSPHIKAPDAQPRFQEYRDKGVSSYYGLGWRLVDIGGERIVYHGGWLKGFTNFLAFLPKHQVGIVILHNAESRFAIKASMSFFDAYLKLKQEGQILE